MPPELRNHVAFIPNKTRGVFKGGYYLLKDGRLVTPYPANSYEMQRDGAIEVEKIKVTEGPQKGLEGWIPAQRLQRLLTMFAM